MRRIIVAFIFVSMVFVSPVLMARDNPALGKGLAYLLIGDKELAALNWETFFDTYPDPSVRGIFMGLMKEGDLWEVTTQFKRYLDNNHRSTLGLLGIALSTTDMKLSTSMENLERAIRLDPSFSSAYLALGAEYEKRKNYPMAISYFNRALSTLYVPEYKILLAKLYLKLNKPGEVLNLLKKEADEQADNYYFNYYTAEAYSRLNQPEEMDKYIHTALEAKPDSQDARLLQAKFLLDKNDLQQALSILKALKFKDFNEDYNKIYAQVLLKLKDKKCKEFMDEVFSRKSWDQEINQLQGLYAVWKKQEGANVQNWINRSILSGSSVEELKKVFPGGYEYREYDALPFFDVQKILWLSDDLLVAAAVQESGEPGKLYFIRISDLKTLNVLAYTGIIQDIFLSRDRTKIIFSTVAVENQSVNVYGVEVSENSARLSPLSSRPLPMPAIDAGFNYTGTLVYITDSRIAKLAFESPFSIESQIGKKTPVYPSYPFPIYQYNFATNQLGTIDINEMKLVGKVPIRNVQKYYLVYETQASKSSVQAMIDRGKQLDLTSSEFVKVFFANDLSAFLVYLSDLKNACQALIYEQFSNRLYKFDETLFLGTGNFAEVTMKNFDPQKKTVLVLTKDSNRRLISYNYTTFLALELADNVEEVFYDEHRNMFYILTERSKKSPFTETNLEIVYSNPFHRETVGTRRDLNKVLFIRPVLGDTEVYFSTFTGEYLMMDGEYRFYYISPSLEGSIHVMSPSRKKSAAFINGRLFILDSLYSPQTGKKAEKAKEK